MCEGSTDVHHLCLWILRERHNSVNWWIWVGDDLEMDHKAMESCAWVPVGRLWPWRHFWRNQDGRLNSMTHSSASYLFSVLWGVCVHLCTHFYICMRFRRKKARIQVSGTLEFRSLTSWVICIASSICSFPISKVGKPPNLAIMRVTWNKVWRVLGHSLQWMNIRCSVVSIVTLETGCIYLFGY